MFGNEATDQLCGDSGNDSLYGGQGSDTLFGGGGEDWLFGDQGDGLISGGEGLDRFVLFANGGTDTITDFQINLDLIVLGGGLTFDQLTLTQDGTSTIISAGGQNLAILTGVQSSSLGTDDFIGFIG
ncbi:MAG: calcium-binding protein [Oscillatoriales cyanobacterium RM2_1_1]|nr:calcium-binding protein [Oscillatoriales cyanobacterium RM2_1_1]